MVGFMKIVVNRTAGNPNQKEIQFDMQYTYDKYISTSIMNYPVCLIKLNI